MMSWFSIATTFALGLSFWPRTRDLDDTEVTPAVRKLRQLLNARIHGNEEHLRIEGTYADTDVAVVVDAGRGQSQLTVEVPSPRGVSLSIAPRFNSHKKEAQYLSTWQHPTKALYSDDLVLASKLVADASISRTLSRLAAEPRFSVVLRDGFLKVTGKVEPDRLSDQFVPELVKEMTRLVRNLDSEPEIKRRVADDALRTKRLRKLQIGAGVFVCLILCSVVAYSQYRSHQPSAWLHPVAIEGWRPIQTGDIDKESRAILQQHGQTFTDRIAGDFSGNGSESGEAAFLVRQDSDDTDAPKYRLVIQTDPPTHFDHSYSAFAFALKVSNRNLHKMGWIGEKPPALSKRDAVLIVQQRSDVRSAQLLLFDGKEIQTYHPEDYRLF